MKTLQNITLGIGFIVLAVFILAALSYENKTNQQVEKVIKEHIQKYHSGEAK